MPPVLDRTDAPRTFSENAKAAPSQNTSNSQVEVRTRSGEVLHLNLERDSYVLPGGTPDEVKLIAELGSTLVLIDTYMSKAGGLSYCQAGQERFLRLIAVRNGDVEETMRIKLESCWQNINLADDGIEWSQETSTLVIHWNSGPSTRIERETLRLEFDTK